MADLQELAVVVMVVMMGRIVYVVVE